MSLDFYFATICVRIKKPAVRYLLFEVCIGKIWNRCSPKVNTVNLQCYEYNMHMNTHSNRFPLALGDTPYRLCLLVKPSGT